METVQNESQERGSTRKFDQRQSRTRLGRRQQFDIQLSQLVDAALMVLSLWLGHLLRQYLGERFPIPEIDSFNMFLWLTLTIPFGPLFLDLLGFYRFPLQKTTLQSLSQITNALLCLGVLIAGCALLFRFDIHSRAVLILFGLISTVLLLIKERIVAGYLHAHTASGAYREKVILIGSTDEIRQFLACVTQEQLALIDVGTGVRPSPAFGRSSYFCNLSHASGDYRAGDRGVRGRGSGNVVSC
jgi:hypothetical protein